MKYIKIIMSISLLTFSCFLYGCEKNTTNDSMDPVSDTLLAPFIKIEENIVSWDSVTFSDYYVVYINDSYECVTKQQFYVVEDRMNGNYEIKVKACDSYRLFKTSSFSNTVNYSVNKKELKVPQVTISGYTLKWPVVEGADYYKIFLDSAWKNTWDIIKQDEYYVCEMYFDTSGTYDINVVAYSNDLEYEKEKSTDNIEYKISIDKMWTSSKIIEDWIALGDVSLVNNKTLVNYYANGMNASLSNNVIVDSNHQFLYVYLNRDYSQNKKVSASSITVTANGTTLESLVESKSSNIPDDVLVYSLSDFIDQVVSINIVFNTNDIININYIRLFTEDNISKLFSWGIYDICQEWIVEGDHEQHLEGFCIECYDGRTSSLTNRLDLSNASILQFSVRKFTRVDGVDENPKLYVYVNGELVKPMNLELDYATATGDAYETYRFDLSKYKGTLATVVIFSAIGEHACFGDIRLTK